MEPCFQHKKHKTKEDLLQLLAPVAAINFSLKNRAEIFFKLYFPATFNKNISFLIYDNEDTRTCF